MPNLSFGAQLNIQILNQSITSNEKFITVDVVDSADGKYTEAFVRILEKISEVSVSIGMIFKISKYVKM
jgi:hypothetical protein